MSCHEREVSPSDEADLVSNTPPSPFSSVFSSNNSFLLRIEPHASSIGSTLHSLWRTAQDLLNNLGSIRSELEAARPALVEDGRNSKRKHSGSGDKTPARTVRTPRRSSVAAKLGQQEDFLNESDQDDDQGLGAEVKEENVSEDDLTEDPLQESNLSNHSEASSKDLSQSEPDPAQYLQTSMREDNIEITPVTSPPTSQALSPRHYDLPGCAVSLQALPPTLSISSPGGFKSLDTTAISPPVTSTTSSRAVRPSGPKGTSSGTNKRKALPATESTKPKKPRAISLKKTTRNGFVQSPGSTIVLDSDSSRETLPLIHDDPWTGMVAAPLSAVQSYSGSRIVQPSTNGPPRSAVPSPPAPPPPGPDINKELYGLADVRSKELSGSNGFPNNFDITTEMFLRLMPTPFPDGCTLPMWSPDVVYDASYWNGHLFFHTEAMEGVLNWIEMKINTRAAIPRVTHADPRFIQHSWWHVLDSNHLSDRLRQLVRLRYGLDPSDGDLDDATFAKVLVDPIFASYFAINWRHLMVLEAQANPDSLEPDTCRKMQLPLEALTSWVIKEMCFNALLMADVHRASVYRGQVSQVLTQNPESLRRKPIFFASQDRELELYIPGAHAMFRGNGKIDNFQHCTVESQPLWVQYLPQPGKLGEGPPPPSGYKTGVELIPGHKPPLDLFEPGGRSLTQDLPPPSSSPGPLSPDDLTAMNKHAQPAALYDPSFYINPPDQDPSDPSVPLCGPGRAAPWPTELTSTCFNYFPGETVFDVSNPTQLLAIGKQSDWRLVDSLPPGVPQAQMIPASRADLKAMGRGCDQGCGNDADLRYLTVNSDGVPMSQVYCGCPETFVSPEEARKHMDICTKAIAAGWTRTGYEKARRLPPVRSDLCGHVICRACATVSVLSAPPFGVCLLCGVRISIIKFSSDFLVPPEKNAIRRSPEIYASGNLLAHHK